MERRSGKQRTAQGDERPEARVDTSIHPPPGLRVFRSVARGIEYAVLVMPKAARNAAGDRLTAAEHEVIGMAVQGLSNEAIAARRGTSARTVANQLQSIYAKLGVTSRLELAACGGRPRQP